MFSGIVEEIGILREVRLEGEPKRLVFACRDVLEGVRVGDSIAVNGVCLTVESFDEGSFTTGVMPETLRRTDLGQLGPGAGVNLERSVPAGAGRGALRSGARGWHGRATGDAARRRGRYRQNRGVTPARALHRREGVRRRGRDESHGS